MSDTLDLDAYLARIGYDGPLEPTLPVLQALHALHPRAIPFENLDVLTGRGVRIDLASVQAKLVQDRRGGYCFEHNSLFAAVLQAIGFDVATLAARVQWRLTEEQVTPRTHMALAVILPEGVYQADVGFGGLVQAAPLKLEPETEQDTGSGLFRFVAVGDELQLQFHLRDGWAPMYQLSLTPQQPVDYELPNWFVSTHPDSIFTANLLAAWVGEDRRYALMNNQLSVYHHNGEVERKELTPEGIEALMHGTFGVTRPCQPEALADLYRKLAGS
jgi:N-hydroxyarylamine O-acetyltransferase